jgi:cell division septal protein FtsQ
LVGIARRHRKKLILFGFLLVCTGGIFYFVFVSSYFTITRVEVLGVESISRDEVDGAVEKIFAQKKIGFFNSKNYFLAPVEKLRASLFEQFPKIEAIDLEKIYRDTLQIHIKERDTLGVWCLPAGDKPEDCFYFDKEGVIFEEAPKSFGQLILSVRDSRNIEPHLGARVLDRKEVTYLGDLRGIMERNFAFGAQTIEIRESGEFEVVTSEGWRVLLNKNDSVSSQLSNLKYVLDETIQARRSELEYVDLRLGNKVYYKYRGTID